MDSDNIGILKPRYEMLFVLFVLGCIAISAYPVWQIAQASFQRKKTRLHWTAKALAQGANRWIPLPFKLI
ncbi:hypothetical protein A9Q80_03340 [Cycloclasticus sp. 46_83_sub15_T18]|nr:hypothetical protein A9Q80_03340 [Cycloclasticus sp. 46_83_sub15_T18]